MTGHPTFPHRSPVEGVELGRDTGHVPAHPASVIAELPSADEEQAGTLSQLGHLGVLPELGLDLTDSHGALANRRGPLKRLHRKQAGTRLSTV
jgi:hypothetical protein